MLLEQYLKNCGITGITSNAIYFKPNIPSNKLSNAINAYGSSVSKNEVLILIDDTFWGSAKEGILITDNAVLFKVAGHGMGCHDLSLLYSAESNENNVTLNGEVVVKLTKAGENELCYLFSMLDEFVANRARASDMNKTGVTGTELDVSALAEICSFYTTPVYFTVEELQAQGTHPSFLDRKPATTPSYYVMEGIPQQIVQMARLSLGIPAQDTLVAVSDLTINGGNAAAAFVVTQRGVYSRDEDGKDTIFIPWDTLGQRSISSEMIIGRCYAIRFDDGTVLPVSNRNVIVKPYGAALIRDLIGLAAACEHLPTPSSANTASVSEKTHTPALTESQMALPVEDTIDAHNQVGVNDISSSEGVQEKLDALMPPIVKENEEWLVSLVKEKAGKVSIAALQSDDIVACVASALYTQLPAPVQFAVTEPAFIGFMLQHRNQLLAQVVQGEDFVIVPTNEGISEPRKRLADIKSPAASRATPGEGRFVSEHFPTLKSELTNAVRELDQFVQTATPWDRHSEEFREAVQKRQMLALVAGITGLALAFPRELAARDIQWNGQNQVIMCCDRAIAEVMIYCFASAANLLHKEAGLDEEDATDIVSELVPMAFHGYFIQEASLSEKRIWQNPNPNSRQLEQLEQADIMQRFRGSMRRLSANKHNDDTQSLLGNFINNLSFSLEELFDSPTDHLAHYRLLKTSEQHIQAVFANMDIEIETLLVEFLEQNQ